MSAYDLGPRSLRVYESLRSRILGGELPDHARLPSHDELAQEYGVAPLTVRQALGRLEQEGYVSRQQGRGTFVRRPVAPAVLIVEDDRHIGELLVEYARAAGVRGTLAATAQAALAELERDPAIGLVLCDVRLPDAETGIALIRQIRRRSPELPLAAVTAYPEDLTALHDSPESPVLVIPKPFRSAQIREALRLALRL
jgi:CheY-like chemotaxis protein